MADQTLQIYAAFTGGTEANVGNAQIPFDALVEGIQYSHAADLDSDETSRLQLSEIVSQQLNQNGAQGVLLNSQLQASFATAASGVVSHAEGYLPVNKRYDAGTLLYIHSVGTAGVTGTFQVVVYLRRGR